MDRRANEGDSHASNKLVISGASVRSNPCSLPGSVEKSLSIPMDRSIPVAEAGTPSTGSRTQPGCFRNQAGQSQAAVSFVVPSNPYLTSSRVLAAGCNGLVPFFTPGSPVSLVPVAMEQSSQLTISGSVEGLRADAAAVLNLTLRSASDAPSQSARSRFGSPAPPPAARSARRPAWCTLAAYRRTASPRLCVSCAMPPAAARRDRRATYTSRLNSSGLHLEGAGPPVASVGACCLRVIPCLDVDAGRVTKGVRFLDNADVGDPVELARHYDEQGADELVFYDITASSQDSAETTYEVVRRTAAQGHPPHRGWGCGRPTTWTACCGPARTRSR